MILTELLSESTPTRQAILDAKVAEIDQRKAKYEQDLAALEAELENADPADLKNMDRLKSALHQLEQSIKLTAGEKYAALSAKQFGDTHDSTTRRLLQRKAK